MSYSAMSKKFRSAFIVHTCLGQFVKDDSPCNGLAKRHNTIVTTAAAATAATVKGTELLKTNGTVNGELELSRLVDGV